MARSAQLPTCGGQPFLIDGGLETRLLFKDGFELPSFASFTLLENREGVTGLEAYYRRFIDIAKRHEIGFVLDAPTWRASPDWGAALGFDPAWLAALNRQAIELLTGLRDGEARTCGPVVVNGSIGPRGDGYVPGATMTAEAARDYHIWQLEVLKAAGADMATALTMTHAGEAEGIAAAASDVGLPVAVSFTVETDGRLPDGMALAEAVSRVDQRQGDAISFYMVNCAHPSHFSAVLASDAELAGRIGGIRANASKMTHAELDEAEELDEGDPDELAGEYREMLEMLPSLCLLGGCCGTDHHHVAAIADTCVPPLKARAAG